MASTHTKKVVHLSYLAKHKLLEFTARRDRQFKQATVNTKFLFLSKRTSFIIYFSTTPPLQKDSKTNLASFILRS